MSLQAEIENLSDYLYNLVDGLETLPNLNLSTFPSTVTYIQFPPSPINIENVPLVTITVTQITPTEILFSAGTGTGKLIKRNCYNLKIVPASTVSTIENYQNQIRVLRNKKNTLEQMIRSNLRTKLNFIYHLDEAMVDELINVFETYLSA